MAGGEFSRWLHGYLRAQTQAEPAGDVPCGDCNACCKASYFISIDSDERETIAHIPAVHLTQTTRAGEPTWTLDQSGGACCPMLVDGACSIYAQRPRTCRRFDCRVFAAAAVGLGTGPRAAVNERVWQWRFDYSTELDAACQSAVLAAAAFMQRRADLIDPEVAPADTAELAKAAVFIYELFLEPCAASVESDATLAGAIDQKLRGLLD
jgi:Fe-S-cluster containining protein